MIGAGTGVFTDVDEYQQACRDVNIESIYENIVDFRARLTWVELKWIKLLRVYEYLPHVAIINLPPNSVFVACPAAANAIPTWCGVPLRRSDIVVHSLGQRIYEYTRGTTTWASISLPPERLAAYGRIWAEFDLEPPRMGQVYDPSASAMIHLRRLHAKVCRLVVTRPEIITHKEVIRSLEEELIHALINCLAGRGARGELQDSTLMHCVDEILMSQPQANYTVTELCAVAGVPERILQEHCKKLVGMDPGLYIHVRRMNLVRSALRDTKSTEDSLASIVSRYGFHDVGRFIRQYKDIFGEEPATTARTHAAN